MTIKKCDVCGIEINHDFAFGVELKTSRAWYLDEHDERFDLCENCYKKIKTMIFDMTKEIKK